MPCNLFPKSQFFGGPSLGSMWGVSGALPLLKEAAFAEVATYDTNAGSTVYACRATRG
ncbi:hypothetical protein ACOCJ7_09610 [Knoellia sp. CPCC 206453]|uniref:hypothetical protein n=1 Tax=Knoellia pratensis TaxID=3404796 RepID=UPI00361A7D8D